MKKYVQVVSTIVQTTANLLANFFPMFRFGHSHGKIDLCYTQDNALFKIQTQSLTLQQQMFLYLLH